MFVKSKKSLIISLKSTLFLFLAFVAFATQAVAGQSVLESALDEELKDDLELLRDTSFCHYLSEQIVEYSNELRDQSYTYANVMLSGKDNNKENILVSSFELGLGLVTAIEIRNGYCGGFKPSDCQKTAEDIANKITQEVSELDTIEKILESFAVKYVGYQKDGELSCLKEPEYDDIPYCCENSEKDPMMDDVKLKLLNEIKQNSLELVKARMQETSPIKKEIVPIDPKIIQTIEDIERNGYCDTIDDNTLDIQKCADDNLVEYKNEDIGPLINNWYKLAEEYNTTSTSRSRPDSLWNLMLYHDRVVKRGDYRSSLPFSELLTCLYDDAEHRGDVYKDKLHFAYENDINSRLKEIQNTDVCDKGQIIFLYILKKYPYSFFIDKFESNENLIEKIEELYMKCMTEEVFSSSLTTSDNMLKYFDKISNEGVYNYEKFKNYHPELLPKDNESLQDVMLRVKEWFQNFEQTGRFKIFLKEWSEIDICFRDEWGPSSLIKKAKDESYLVQASHRFIMLMMALDDLDSSVSWLDYAKNVRNCYYPTPDAQAYIVGDARSYSNHISQRIKDISVVGHFATLRELGDLYAYSDKELCRFFGTCNQKDEIRQIFIEKTSPSWAMKYDNYKNDKRIGKLDSPIYGSWYYDKLWDYRVLLGFIDAIEESPSPASLVYDFTVGFAWDAFDELTNAIEGRDKGGSYLSEGKRTWEATKGTFNLALLMLPYAGKAIEGALKVGRISEKAASVLLKRLNSEEKALNFAKNNLKKVREIAEIDKEVGREAAKVAEDFAIKTREASGILSENGVEKLEEVNKRVLECFFDIATMRRGVGVRASMKSLGVGEDGCSFVTSGLIKHADLAETVRTVKISAVRDTLTRVGLEDRAKFLSVVLTDTGRVVEGADKPFISSFQGSNYKIIEDAFKKTKSDTIVQYNLDSHEFVVYVKSSNEGEDVIRSVSNIRRDNRPYYVPKNVNSDVDLIFGGDRAKGDFLLLDPEEIKLLFSNVNDGDSVNTFIRGIKGYIKQYNGNVLLINDSSLLSQLLPNRVEGVQSDIDLLKILLNENDGKSVLEYVTFNNAVIRDNMPTLLSDEIGQLLEERSKSLAKDVKDLLINAREKYANDTIESLNLKTYVGKKYINEIIKSYCNQTYKGSLRVNLSRMKVKIDQILGHIERHKEEYPNLSEVLRSNDDMLKMILRSTYDKTDKKEIVKILAEYDSDIASYRSYLEEWCMLNFFNCNDSRLVEVMAKDIKEGITDIDSKRLKRLAHYRQVYDKAEIDLLTDDRITYHPSEESAYDYMEQCVTDMSFQYMLKPRSKHNNKEFIKELISSFNNQTCKIEQATGHMFGNSSMMSIDIAQNSAPVVMGLTGVTAGLVTVNSSNAEESDGGASEDEEKEEYLVLQGHEPNGLVCVDGDAAKEVREYFELD